MNRDTLEVLVLFVFAVAIAATLMTSATCDFEPRGLPRGLPGTVNK